MDGDDIMIPAQALDLQRMMTQLGGLVLWVVYENPKDYPGQFVARPGVTGGMGRAVLLADSLDELRALLPPGLHRLERDPNDDPVVVEVWV